MPVQFERLGDGSAAVRLARNVHSELREGETIFVYDEVTFTLPPERAETRLDIESCFFDWWAFGAEPESTEPTIEERLETIESVLMEILGGGM